MKAEVTRQTRLEGIPSASALARVGNQLLIAGDDSPFLFQTDLQGKVLDRIRVFPGDEARIPKAEKPDIEAMALLGNEDGVLLFGSGSKLPKRGVIVHWPTAGKPKVYAAEAFYRHVMAACGIGEDDLNIEGAACHGWELFLLNRGGNQVIQLQATALLAHLMQGGALPALSVQAYELPRDTGHLAGFSGAAALDHGRLLFCASVEATANWIDDGEVLGSYVGLIDLDAPDKLQIAPIMHDGKRFLGKVEAIELRRELPGGVLEAWAVTDDDAGGSDLLELKIWWEG